VCGEALIDVLPQGPVPGGGPANTAIALARLDVDVHFIGGLSSDAHGQLLRRHLSSNGVDLTHAMASDLPTALAIVTLDARGSASYDFQLEQTATFTFESRSLPAGTPRVVHVGSLATIVEPSASALHDWARSIDAPIVFDPNVRSAVVSDVEQYRAAVERWASIASIIKLSDDDLAFLYPGIDEVQAVRRLLHEQVHAVVLTRGVNGVMAVTRDATVVIPGRPVDVVDTVGAGDTVGAVLVEAMMEAPVSALTGERLEYVLDRAVRAAAITCTRAGCQPPTLADLADHQGE
jgi:fructokinase